MLAGDSLQWTSAIAEPVSLQGQTANVGPLIVDDKLLQALEADIMPAGLEEQEHKAVAEDSRAEKTYNYEATTVRTLLLTSCAIQPTQQGIQSTPSVPTLVHCLSLCSFDQCSQGQSALLVGWSEQRHHLQLRSDAP